MIVFQLIVLPPLVFLCLRSIYRLLRGDHPRRGLTLGALTWLVAAISVARPELTTAVARGLGIGRGTDLMVYLVALVFLLTTFWFYHKVRQLESNITELVRSLALQGAVHERRDDETARPTGED